MKITNPVIVFFCFLSFNLFAQEWNSQAPNTLFAENSNNDVSPIAVGIGTSNPSAVLHTNGNIRFQGVAQSNNITGLLGTLPNGDVRLLNGSPWLLNGNTTNAADFIGTLNQDDFRVRTNNVQRMVVTSGGRIGFNSIGPGQAFQTNLIKSIDARFLDANTYVANTDALDGIFVYNRFIGNAATGVGASITLAAVGGQSANQCKATISGVVTGRDAMDLVFQNEFRDFTPAPNTNQGLMRESMRITSAGFVGIGTNAPAVQLHTTGEVQLDGIPQGGGCFLALDGNNRVVVTNSCTDATPFPGGFQEKIASLEDRVAELEAFIMEHMEAKNEGSFDLPASSKAMLYQNTPNPFNTATQIRAFVPQSAQTAILKINDISGKTIKTVELQERGNIQVELVNKELSTGMYFYTLIVDGAIIDTKKMTTSSSSN